MAKYEQLGEGGERVPAAIPLVPRARMERLRALALDEGLTNVVWSGMTRREEEEA